MSNIKAIISDRSITVFISGDSFSVDSSFVDYDKLIDAIHRGDELSIRIHIDKFREMIGYTKHIEGLNITKSGITYDGMKLHGTLVDTIMAMILAEEDYAPLERFLQNIAMNPSDVSKQELIEFLDTGKFPITEDGCFLAYKKVRPDYTDIHSGTFDNSIGCVLTMNRDDVDPDRTKTCSQGLHFCSYDYLPHFWYKTDEDRIMIVKINPIDVVSIPDDYNYTKGRTWRYEVVDEITEENPALYMNDAPVWHNEDEAPVAGTEDAFSAHAMKVLHKTYGNSPYKRDSLALDIAEEMRFRPGEEIHVRELADTFDEDTSSINKAMKVLLDEELVDKVKIGTYVWTAD